VECRKILSKKTKRISPPAPLPVSEKKVFCGWEGGKGKAWTALKVMGCISRDHARRKIKRKTGVKRQLTYERKNLGEASCRNRRWGNEKKREVKSVERNSIHRPFMDQRSVGTLNFQLAN